MQQMQLVAALSHYCVLLNDGISQML